MTIGNFHDDENTEISPNGINGAYYFIDHISVKPTTYNLQVIGDKELCYGESTTLYAVGDCDYRWVTSTDPTTVISTDSVLVIKPLLTTTYIVYGSNDTASITIRVSDPIPLDLGPDRLLCQGESMQLDVATWGATYIWQDSSTKSKYTIRKDGIYWVDVTIDECTVRDSIIIVYQALPEVNLGNDTLICPGDIINLDAYKPGATYQWQNNSNSSIFDVTQQGQYWVEVSYNGCRNSDTINIYFDDESCHCELFVPNAFSPNGDGLNDLIWAIPKCPVKNYSFSIYNRWGSKVYESDQPGQGWDGYFNGRRSPVGVYIYQASFNYRGSEKPKVQKGSITLIR
jgi:gliding motility-associated-like protein